MAEKLNNLEDLYVMQLQDLYDAENQLIEALPKLARAAQSPALKRGFEEHLEQTKEHARRIEEIFDELEESLDGKKCVGMAGIVKEGEEVLKEKIKPDVIDAALIAAAQHAEHYEIAGYGTARAFAEKLGNSSAAQLLQKTLDEEFETDKKLTKLAETHLNAQAL